MNSNMNKNRKIWVVITVTLITVALLAALWASYSFLFPFAPTELPERRLPPPGEIGGDFELFYVAQSVISTVNFALLVFLLTTYLDIYRKTRSHFTLGLIIFSSIFLLRTLTANPLFMWVFGFRAFGLGPFALLPDLLEFVALSVLLYLSAKY